MCKHIRDSKILESTIAKAYGEIEKFNYSENITESLLFHKVITQEQCQEIRSAKTSVDKNRLASSSYIVVAIYSSHLRRIYIPAVYGIAHIIIVYI